MSTGTKVCSKCGKEYEGKHPSCCSECVKGWLNKGAAKKKRAERVPLTEKRVMDYKYKDENFEYHYFNDKDGRVERAELAGWEAVIDENDDAGCDVNNVRGRDLGSAVVMHAGKGVKAVLMRKPKDEFDADMKISLDRAREDEAAILQYKDRSNFYEPSGVKTKIGGGLYTPVQD